MGTKFFSNDGRISAFTPLRLQRWPSQAHGTAGLIASPDTRRITLTTEDEFFLIGCDGLWDVMTHEESVGFVKERLDQGITPQKMSEHIVKEALKRGSKDNITVLVVTLKRLAEASAPAEAPASDTPESSDAAATPANDVEPSA